MSIPKSQKLLRAEMKAAVPEIPEEVIQVVMGDEPIKIKNVPCLNDFVAILQFRVKSSIELGDTGYKQEGMVTGFGPGLPTASGTRCPSQLKLGKVISFFGQPTLTLSPKSGVFAGRKVVIVPERNLICYLPQVPFEIVDEGDDEKS